MTQRMEYTNTVGKMTLIDLLNTGLWQTFNLLKKKKAISAKHNKAKYDYISKESMRKNCLTSKIKDLRKEIIYSVFA